MNIVGGGGGFKEA